MQSATKSDLLYDEIRRRAATGQPMLSDSGMGRRLNTRVGGIAAILQRLRRVGRIEVELQGTGMRARRRVKVTATGELTDWSVPPNTPPRETDLRPTATIDDHEAALARASMRFEDVPLRATGRPLVYLAPPPAHSGMGSPLAIFAKDVRIN